MFLSLHLHDNEDWLIINLIKISVTEACFNCAYDEESDYPRDSQWLVCCSRWIQESIEK